ncbi:MAG: 3'(2'),5'-bisphosphate nucleotidase CysQ [Paracoccaceae bacterium]
MDFDRIARAARNLAIEAGAAIMEVYWRDGVSVSRKEDESPVTEADLAADAIIYAGLRKRFPGIPVVTEERAESHGVDSGTFFIVDPLDGTKEFIQKRGEFTVNIALVIDGVPRLGVVFAPAKTRLFWTAEDGRSVEEDGPHFAGRIGNLTPIRVSQPDNAALSVVASKSHRDAATDAYISKYRTAEFLSAGSSLKFCLVAAGEADLYPRLGRTMEWDTAAGHAVLLGAGGRVVRFDDHSDLRYAKPGYENPFFIAFAPGVALKDA